MFLCIYNNFLYIGHNILLNYYILLFSLFPNYFKDAIINAKKRNDNYYNRMMFINFSTDIYNKYNIDIFSIINTFNNTCKNNHKDNDDYHHLNDNNNNDNDVDNDNDNDNDDDNDNDNISIMSDLSNDTNESNESIESNISIISKKSN
jgi:hypothetical protein